MPIVIEDAVEADLPAMLAIYNEVILPSTAVYTEAPETLAQRQSWWRQRRAQGYPVLVARDSAAEVLGFASFGDFRPAWPGYRFTVEHSVHVRADGRGLDPVP